VIARGDLLATPQALHHGRTTPDQAARCLVVLDSFLNYMWMMVLVCVQRFRGRPVRTDKTTWRMAALLTAASRSLNTSDAWLAPSAIR
jgi:hypothetical protein